MMFQHFRAPPHNTVLQVKVLWNNGSSFVFVAHPDHVAEFMSVTVWHCLVGTRKFPPVARIPPFDALDRLAGMNIDGEVLTGFDEIAFDTNIEKTAAPRTRAALSADAVLAMKLVLTVPRCVYRSPGSILEIQHARGRKLDATWRQFYFGVNDQMAFLKPNVIAKPLVYDLSCIAKYDAMHFRRK